MTRGGVGLAFWASMLVAQAGAFVIFKDLADISQWLVQSSRGFTMAVWYNRYWIAGGATLALAAALVLWLRQRCVCPRWALTALVAVFALNMYAGLLNPALMFRPQQHEAKFVPVAEAPEHMRRSLEYAHFGDASYDSVEQISMLVLETDDGAYAFSDYYLLQPHVAKAGTVEGEAVVMTYCGLTNLGIAYSPVIDGQPLELSVMTQLKNNLVLKDANTGEPIQQIWGHMEGAPQRSRMQEHATVRMPFRSFRELYPDGRVYVNEIPSFSENPVLAGWDRLVRHGMMYWGVGLQWNQPEAPAFPTIEDPDPRLPMKELVYALNVGEDFVAYTKAFIIEQGGIVNVTIGGRDVVIDHDAGYDVVSAWFNDTGAPVSAVDVRGRLPSGERLTRVHTLKSKLFWFIYAEFYPHTDVNRV